MAELLTQIQDELFRICHKFRDCVGVLQQDAPPQQVDSEELLAQPPNPAFDLQASIKAYTTDIMELIKTVDSLAQLLPDDVRQPAAGDVQQQQLFEADVRQLQQQHQEVTQELTAAVDEVEGLLELLQQMYAVLAQEKLKTVRNVNE